MTIRLLLPLLCFGFFACGSAPVPETESAPMPAPVAPATGGAAITPAPGDLPYPVYTSFDQLAPLFEQDNDTTYVINFWATWCKPCVEELPYFEKLATETANQPVKIVMVSLDFAKEVRGKLLDFVTNRPLDLPVIALVDGRYNDWIDRVDPQWGGAIPITVVYKGKKRIFKEDQFASYAELAALVNQVKS